ncbi:MAG: hypothetical protein II929_00050 [Succinivibrio sp.]|nr:hypothetical protein [Succinivibrio sp.]
MKSLKIVKSFDDSLYSYFVKEIERQHVTLSFIPDENSTSPVCAAIMGSVLVNSSNSIVLGKGNTLETLTCERLCDVFGAEFATVKTVTIEAASRVVFKALTTRGDVVMSLDLRKKEHCNSENLAFQFVNFGIDPETQTFNMKEIEAIAKKNKPKLIIVSPVNYPLSIDFAKFSKIAKEVGAYLWCDLSQTAGLTAAGVLPSPVKYADVVTLSTHGAMQGPQAAAILCKKELATAIVRSETLAGHHGLITPQLSALAARLHEMKTDVFVTYCKDVVANAKALAKGLEAGGMKLVCNGTNSHLVIIDTRFCAIAAKGAQELLADIGIHVRIANVLTSDPKIKFEAVRFSTLPATTRGMKPKQMEQIGEAIGKFLAKPDEDNSKALMHLVATITAGLPSLDRKYLDKSVAAVITDE